MIHALPMFEADRRSVYKKEKVGIRKMPTWKKLIETIDSKYSKCDLHKER